MYLGKVIGTVVATRKHEALEGIRLRVVQLVNENLEPLSDVEVAVDVVSADTGQYVYLVGSREAALALEESFTPVDSAIVGIVDRIDD
jgi:ethanolamine utilization protein EutN